MNRARRAVTEAISELSVAVPEKEVPISGYFEFSAAERQKRNSYHFGFAFGRSSRTSQILQDRLPDGIDRGGANKVVLKDGVMRLVILNLNPNPLTGFYCHGIASQGDWSEKLRYLQDQGISISTEPDWLSEDKQRVLLRDPEGNLLTIFGID